MAPLIPHIDLNKCDGRGFCTHVCQHGVFEIKPISRKQYAELSVMGKLNVLLGNNRKAVAVNPERCQNCGLCVSECPKQAITLLPVD
ncbi:MAG: ferredoxin family protein [Chitinophagales bacterium]